MNALRESSTYQAILAEGRKQGLAEAWAEGFHDGKVELLGLLLQHRYSTLPAESAKRLDPLTSAQLNEFALAMMEFKGIEDVEEWLAQHLP